MSDTYITLSIPTSIIPGWDQGQDEAENAAQARIREGCQWLKTRAVRLVVVIDPRNWIAYGVNPDTDRDNAILFIVRVADFGTFLISLLHGDITKIRPPNGAELTPYSLEIGGNKPPPPPVPHSINPDAAVRLGRAIGADSAAVPEPPEPAESAQPVQPAEPAGTAGPAGTPGELQEEGNQ